MKGLLTLIAVFAIPGVAYAQPPPEVPKGLRASGFPTAYVVDDKGVETKGGLFRIDERSVVLLIDGQQREFDLAHVTQVTRRGDSLKNGAIGGAVFGALMGILAGAISDCATDSGYGSCGAGTRIGIAIASTAFYTAVGVGIDALIQGRTVLYQAPPTRGVTFRLGGPAIGFRVSW